MSEHTRHERIHKVLARAGVGSRRQIETWVREGRIAVNGQPAAVGAQIGPRDRVTLDGRPLRVREPDSDTRVMLYHRSPRRALTEGEEDVEPVDLGAKLPRRAGRRWISVSPLPPNDGGLEVLTSDGDLAQALMRRLGSLRIEFALRVRGEPTLGQMEHLKSGVFDGGTLQVESVVPAGGEGFNRWLRLVTMGARARDVHRLCAAAGLQISRILRVSLGPLRMDRGLTREHTEPLPARETAQLYELMEIEPKVPAPTPRLARRSAATRGSEQSDRKARSTGSARKRTQAGSERARRGAAGAKKKTTGRDAPPRRERRTLARADGRSAPSRRDRRSSSGKRRR